MVMGWWSGVECLERRKGWQGRDGKGRFGIAFDTRYENESEGENNWLVNCRGKIQRETKYISGWLGQNKF